MNKQKIMLAISLIGLLVVGCGTTETSSSNKEILVEENSMENSKTSEEGKIEADVQEEMVDLESVNEETIITEQVLLEENDVKITATGMESDSIWGDGIGLLIENNTVQNIGITCNALIVNDYMITDLFSSTVAAGKKANEVMYISSTELEAAGISNIGQIEVYFHIYDSDSYETLWDSECITIQTSNYANMDTEVTAEGEELYNQDGIRIVGKYVDEESFWGTAVLLYIENTTEKNISVSCDNMSVNGYMVTPVFSSTVYAGKKAVDDITIFSSDLESNGIEAVEAIEVNFHIYDANSYETICDTGAISFSIK